MECQFVYFVEEYVILCVLWKVTVVVIKAWLCDRLHFRMQVKTVKCLLLVHISMWYIENHQTK